MTEAQWLACKSLVGMLRALLGRTGGKRPWARRARASERKLRLLGCAAARALPLTLGPPLGPSRQQAIEVSERYADGAATREELGRARCADAWWVVAAPHASTSAEGISNSQLRGKKAELGAYLHCIFGNPFRPVGLGRTCVTPTVAGLAAAAYEERLLPSGHLEPARLAVLADALEEAGCADDALLGHLRSPGPHVRGCWALDLVLGKE